MTTPNTHKVPLRQWRKWSEHAKRVFNTLFSTVEGNQGIVTHPQAKLIPEKEWCVIAWNVAWLAADDVDDQGLKKGDVVEDFDLKTKEIVRSHTVH